MKTRMGPPCLRKHLLSTALGASLLLTAGCELPPDRTWRIIRRDGLITYLDNEHHPERLSTRYLHERSPYPRRPRGAGRFMVVEHPDDTRYLESRKAGRVRVQKTYSSLAEPVAYQRPEAASIPDRAASSYSPSARTTASGSNRSQLKPSTAPAPARQIPASELPFGTPAPGRPGMVYSPYATRQQLVDVAGMATGEVVRDPYSGKLFRVPPPLDRTPAPDQGPEKLRQKSP